MLFATITEASASIAATSSRTAKINHLAEVLRQCSAEELPVAVGFLTGSPRQGRIGVGWATVTALDVPSSTGATVELLDIHTLLDELADTTGTGSVDARRQLIVATLQRCTADEQHFLHRLLLGDLRQGALEGLMADAVAKATGVPAAAVRSALTLMGDLGDVAALAAEHGAPGLAAARLQVGRALQPMLAATSAGVADAITELGESSVEWKLDGARIQVHRDHDDVRIFTRNLNDVTHRLPEVVKVIRALNVSTLVADGEALTIGSDGRPAKFQDTISRFGRDDADPAADLPSDLPSAELRPFLFDLLHVDGEDLLHLGLGERLARLRQVAPDHGIPGVITDDPDVAQAMLDQALEHGHEGVMVKAIGSPYEAGRRGKAWRKVKPVRTFDLVVLGAEWGHGRRQGWLSNLHLGARDPVTGGFVMVGKTFKGLTDALLTWQTAALLEIERERQGITVFVRPELVIEIALDGVQRSSRYPGGVALRFARVKGYRTDRDPQTADTIDSVRELLG